MQRVEFTKEMKKTHKILVPMMLPIHFQFLQISFNKEGYNVELLETKGQSIIDEGLKMYTTILVILPISHWTDDRCLKEWKIRY